MEDDTNTATPDAVRYETLRPDGGTGAADLAPWSGEVPAAAGPAGLPAVTQTHEPIDVGGDDGDVPRTLRDAVLADVNAYYAEADLDDEFAAAPSESFVDHRWFDFGFLEGRRAVEHYWVNKPFAFVTVLDDAAGGDYEYHVSEPVLDDFETYVHGDLTKILRNKLLYRDLDHDGDRATVFEGEAKAVMMHHAATVEDGSLHKLLYYLLRDFIHMGPIDPLMRDGGIEDISCDGDEIPVFVYHGGYRDLVTNVVFAHGELSSFTVRLAQRAGKPISISDPLVDASLSDGSRVQLTLGTDISTRGSNFTIRKFSEVPYTPVDLVRWNTFSVEEMAYFWLAIENNRSLLFAGGTGSGKTTSMNAVSFFIPQNSKVVSIEDTREITLPHDNWIQSVTRDTFTADGRGEVSMYALLQAALRQRPEYLLVGEIRTEQRVALTFFHAIATGHTAYSTFHADSVEGVLTRMQNEPLGVPTQMLDGLDIVSVQRQIYQGEDRVRRNVGVTELVSTEPGSEVELNPMFARDAVTDAHQQVGESRVLAEIAAERGWSAADVDRELRDRADVLRYLVEYDVRDYREVAATIRAYTKNPDAVLARVRADECLPTVVEAWSESGDAVGGDEDGAAHADAGDADPESEVPWDTLLNELFEVPDLEDSPDDRQTTVPDADGVRAETPGANRETTGRSDTPGTAAGTTDTPGAADGDRESSADAHVSDDEGTAGADADETASAPGESASTDAERDPR